MSIYLGHSSMFDRNQFRVLFDWFDFIRRCFFHSRWSCPLNQAVNLWLRIVQWLAIDQDRFDWLLVCLFQTDSWSQFIILWLSKYQSCLPDYAVYLCHFYNDTELGLLFQSISHSFRSSSLLFLMTQRSHIEHSQMTIIPIYQS